MADREHIVIVAKGGMGWLGGRQYTLSLLIALIDHRRAGGGDYDLSVVVNPSDETLSTYAPLAPELRHCVEITDAQEDWTLAARLRWRLKRSLGGWVNPRLEEALLRLGATFAYPVSARQVPSADWFPDFQHHHFPDGASPEEIRQRQLEIANIVARAERIVLSSACAERDCHNLFPASTRRTAVLRFRTASDPTWIAARPEDVVAKYHLPARFALVSNWLAPTKNHRLILEALARIPEPARRHVRVVFTGDIYDRRNPGFYNGFLSAIHELGVSDNVSHLGAIPKSDQIQLLRAAEVYLQPSRSEGWNTGVEEARMLGKPLLISDIAVHREQAPPLAAYFSPDDAAALADLLAARFDAPPSPAGDEAAALTAYEGLRTQFAEAFLSIARSPKAAEVAA
jgi:glycosyltransferase involved in cell wall biosynthesis